MTTEIKKPIPLRIIFILNALMMFLPFVFYYVITNKGLTIDGLNPQYMLYTGGAYILSFALLVYSILSKNIMLLRIILGLNFIIAFPASAYIGMLVSVVSIILSFNSKVVSFFTS